MNEIARHLGSFKLRLVAFFLLLSLLPLTAALWAFSEVAERSETSRADTRVNAALRIAAGAYNNQVADAANTAEALAVATANQQGLVGQNRVVLSRLYQDHPRAVFYRNGVRIAGTPPPRMSVTQQASITLNGRRVGRVIVWVPLDENLIKLLRRRSGLEDQDDLLVLSRGERVIVGSRMWAPFL